MKALVSDLRINSLYSIRIPFTWQSSLTYPILPPSSVIGLLANGLQRYKSDRHPLEYLKLLEDDILWTGSRLLTPCIIKSYTTSAIVKWEVKLGGKFTNALGRQYAYSQRLQIAAIFKNDRLITDVANALKATPLTCGDSESAASIENLSILNVERLEFNKDIEIETNYFIPMKLENYEILEGTGRVYLMHKRCRKLNGKFPLHSFLVPIKEENGILMPSILRLRMKSKSTGFKIDGIGVVVSNTG